MQLSLFDPVEIPLTKGLFTLVDPCDSDLMNLKWHVGNARPEAPFYARHTINFGKRTRYICLHRLILARKLGRELQSHELVDHIDGNGLNNRRSNLRLATSRQNARNRKKRSDNASGYKGVYFHKGKRKWEAQIGVNGKRITIGSFPDKDTAYEAYCKAAIEHFGEFARF